MKRFLFLFGAALLACGMAATAQAQKSTPDILIEAWIESEVPVQLVVVPSGSGPAFADAHAWGGSPVDATIHMTMLDVFGDPVPDFPYEDLWLESTLGELRFCLGGTVASANTDPLGQTSWTGPLFASGFVDPRAGDVLQVIFIGDRFEGMNLDLITIVSPDLNGDLIINLSDVALFAEDYLAAAGGAGPRRSDLLWDGVMNLSDVAILAAHYGVSCP